MSPGCLFTPLKMFKYLYVYFNKEFPGSYSFIFCHSVSGSESGERRLKTDLILPLLVDFSP